MALSYINFYIANGAVIVPAFGDPQDEATLRTIAREVPDRKTIQIPGLAISTDLGCLHCATQQQPASVARNELSKVVVPTNSSRDSTAAEETF